MKYRFCLLIALLLSHFVSSAQNFKEEQRIYLWDVTLSMAGFGGKPDIWDEVQDDLIKAIEEVQDERTQLVIIPFQGKVLEVLKRPANAQGKKWLIEKIKSYQPKNLTVTTTNICAAWDKGVSLVDARKRNYMFLLTDGIHTAKSPPKSCVPKKIKEWCGNFQNTDAFAFYVMLTPFARDASVKTAIKNSCKIYEVDTPKGQVIDLTPASTELFGNLNDALDFELSFSSPKLKNLPTDFVFDLRLEENDYLELVSATEYSLTEGKARFQLKPKGDMEEVKRAMDEEHELKLKLQSKKELVYFTPGQLTIRIKNKKEKVLKIYVQQ